MTLNEWLMRDPAHQCDIHDCDWDAHPVPIGQYAVRLCNGHERELNHRGRTEFEIVNAIDLGQLASGYGESFRRWMDNNRVGFCRICGAKMGAFGCSMNKAHDEESEAIKQAEQDLSDRFLS